MDWNRADIVTAGFAAGGPRAVFDLVRTQTLLFLVDRAVSERMGGPFFDFRPHHNGPFDRDVYRVLAGFPDPVADYVKRASRWVRLMPHRRRLAAIRRQYPEMAVNSVVRHLASERPARRPAWNPTARRSAMCGAPLAGISRRRWSGSVSRSDFGEQNELFRDLDI